LLSELLLFLLVSVLALAYTGKRISRKVKRRYKSVTGYRKTSSGSSSFDADSAQPQTENTVLSGSAYIVDGDTIVIQKTQIRLFGIDAPELNHPYGKKAKWALVSLCKGQTIEAHITEYDSHGRTVARCYFQDGRDLSAEMVKLGLAIDWPKFSGGKYRSLETSEARKKLWLADARQKGRMKVWKQFEER
jgi:endonuclease YncB( thermonuclease family)